MDNARFTPLENIDSRNKGQSRVFNFRCANESGEYAKEFARRHSLPGVVIELIGFINGDMDVNVMSIASEEAYKIKEVLEEGKIDAIRDIELAWKTLCVILYGKTQYLIKNVTNPKDFINFFKELKKDNYLQLEFAPEDSRKLPFCCDVFQNLQIMQKISIFFAKASVTGAQYTYLTGGIVLLPSSGE